MPSRLQYYCLALIFWLPGLASAQITWVPSYLDGNITVGTPGIGFADGTVTGSTTYGQLRRDTVTAAFTYLDTILDGRGTVRVQFDASTTLTGNTLGSFGANSVPTINGTFQGGPLYQRARSNTSPLNQTYDANGSINFSRSDWFYDVPNSSTSLPGNIDLISVVSHELGHALGFLSYSAHPAVADFGKGLNTARNLGRTNVYSTYDQNLQMGNTPLAGALMNTDITSTSYGSYNTAIATSVYTNGNDASTGLFFGGKYTNEVFNAPVPLYAPSVFAQGSSVSHDNVPSSPTTSIGLMNFNITSSTVRRFQPYEIAMLMDMGWNVYDWNSTTGNWLDGVNNLAASRWTTNQGIVTNTDQSAQYNTHNSTAEAPILPVYGQVTSNIVLNFRGSGTQNYTATNDIGTVRVSRLQLDSSSSNAITIAGGTMNFGQNSDGSASVLVPKIVQQNSGDFLIGSTIQTNNVLTQALVGSVSFPGATGVTVDGTGSGTVTLSGTINGSGTLTKAGTFTLVVSGSSNNYGGTTTVNAGTLLVANTAGSALGSGNVQVNTGATLGGTGAFTGAATISNGGAITAGTTGPSAVRTLGTGPLTLQGKYLVTIFGTGTTDNSRLSVTGDLNLTASTDSLQLSLNGTDVASLRSLGSRSYTVATYTGTLTGNAAIDTLDVTTAGFQSNEWSLTYPANSVVLNFTPSAVPEPGSVFLFGAIGIGIVGSRRTRKWWRIG